MASDENEPEPYVGAEVRERVRELREGKGMRQEDLAEAMNELFGFNWRPSTVTRVESGRRELRIGEFLALTLLFGIDPWGLVVRSRGRARVRLAADAEAPAVPVDVALDDLIDTAEVNVAGPPFGGGDLESWAASRQFGVGPDEAQALRAAARGELDDWVRRRREAGALAHGRALRGARNVIWHRIAEQAAAANGEQLPPDVPPDTGEKG